MKEYLVITIDVEPDCTPNWKYSDPLTFTGVTEGIAGRLQPLFNRYNITPTYLINNVVLEDEASVAVLQQLPGAFELGTHLHPEFIEPQKEFEDYSGKKGQANCCFYPPDIEFEKIQNITNLFERKFGYRPTSFRAGRFSAGNNTIQSLRKLGYKVDTSVTPNVRWDDRTRERAVDFRHAPDQPYWINPDSIIHPSVTKEMLEVPVSIALKPMSLLQQLRYIKRNKRIPFRGSRPVWLRPVFSNQPDFEFIIQQLRNSHSGRQGIVYNMMFHNVEVMPGLSPYSINENDCRQYLDSLETFFQYTKKQDIKSIALSDTYEIFKQR